MTKIRISELWPLVWLMAAAVLILVLIDFEIYGSTVTVLCSLGASVGAQQPPCPETHVWGGSWSNIGIYVAALGLIGVGVLRTIRNAIRPGF